MPDESQPVRPLWSGTVSFGLVSVPVDLVSATRGGSASVSLRMLAPDGTALRREYVCPTDDRPLEPDEIVRAYETPSGFVVLTDAELEGLAPESSRDLEIRQFVPLARLSPLSFERAYFLLPGSSALKPYRLLALTLERRGQAGIGRFVMRGHQHVAAILAKDGLLRLETLRFAEQLRTPAAIGLPSVPSSLELDAGLVERFGAAIAANTTELDLAELEDQTATRIRELAERKRAEGRDVVAPPSGSGDEQSVEAEVIDLMQVLERSLARPTG